MPEHPTDAHFLFTFVFKQALIIKDRIKGLSNRHKVKKSNLGNKIRTAYGLSVKPVSTDTTHNKRYDFEETDYPHED